MVLSLFVGSTDGKGATIYHWRNKLYRWILDQLIGRTPGENFDINVTFRSIH